jgi:hypothetical protein
LRPNISAQFFVSEFTLAGLLLTLRQCADSFDTRSIHAKICICVCGRLFARCPLRFGGSSAGSRRCRGIQLAHDGFVRRRGPAAAPATTAATASLAASATKEGTAPAATDRRDLGRRRGQIRGGCGCLLNSATVSLELVRHIHALKSRPLDASQLTGLGLSTC